VFQQWAIEGIVTGHHVLVTAPTGSGKSLPAEFAIDYFHSVGKKTIYCSPIKALSNQKYYDFTLKYPHIKIGLITGDIKTNPDADVLIMTTEILLNKLYQINAKTAPINSAVSFDMNIENDLACVIFDEIHMINDEDRGHVWENCIMMLPEHIQMVGLSATLADPDKFASWLENRGPSKIDTSAKKIVYLTKKRDRAVPLTHYTFLTSNTSVFKSITDKATRDEINQFTNKLHIIQDAKGIFNDGVYSKTNKILKLFNVNNIRIKRNHVINQVVKLLVENEMLPALCYVFSRKQVDLCAKELTTNVLEIDSKIPSIVGHECEQIIRKLPNYNEYLNLPEYLTLVTLLEKGIATHHSGMMPILREIVELMFMKGYIKVLFCTESVAIGLNLPVKTTIFTDINKHDGSTFRKLHGHEFVQASGRAGRLGLDTVGNVIHLNNLFREMDSASYKHMMMGKPQPLVSKFKISYNLLLNLINGSESNLLDFSKKSMITVDYDEKIRHANDAIINVNSEIDKLKLCISLYVTPENIIEEYIQLEHDCKVLRNKKQKQAIKRIDEIKTDYKFIDKEKTTYINMSHKREELDKMKHEFKDIHTFIENGINNTTNVLINEKFIETNSDDSCNYKLTNKGLIASHLREVPALVFAHLIDTPKFNEMTTIELISFLSCFTNLSVSDEYKDHFPQSNSVIIINMIDTVIGLYGKYQDAEFRVGINSGTDYTIHYDLINYVYKWTNCADDLSCKILLTEMLQEKGIFLGEFVKALMKINNICAELSKIAELIGNVCLLSKLREIPELTLKYVVTNQSLYV
jgi:superfamily II RNA helicase